MFRSFDTSRLKMSPLAERIHDFSLSEMLELKPISPVDEKLVTVAERIITAKRRGAAVILMMGAHVLRSGVQLYIIDLMKNGYISCIAMNGACIIHDFELSLIGQTTESVGRYIREGQFGLWKETGQINDIVNKAARVGLGLGEGIGKAISEGSFPYKNVSIFASGYLLKVLLTVHVGIGYDITHEHPNCDGKAYGATSYLDFLRFAELLGSLEGGVIMNFGSAVMAPEVYLKALAMARNLAKQENRTIQNFTTLVCDLYPLPESYQKEAPRNSSGYYFRPWKTMLVRTVADGGEGLYVKGSHAETIPQLWTAIQAIDQKRIKRWGK